jgi:hypothetical protein
LRCRFNHDPLAAARDLASLKTPSRKMLPLRLTLFKQFFAAGAALASPQSALAGPIAAAFGSPTVQVSVGFWPGLLRC